MDYFPKYSPEHAQRVQQHHDSVAKSERRQQFKTARKKLKRNLQPKGPRKKNWTLEDHEDWDNLDYESQQRIMPLDENDRRRFVEQTAFGSAPLEDYSPAPLRTAATRRGLVLSVNSGQCTVQLDGRSVVCAIRGALTSEETGFTNAVATGDEVVVTGDGAGNGIIEEVLPRRSVLARPDVFRSHLQQVIVANAHQLLIVASWRDPVIWFELIDRYLIAAERSNLEPVICVTKADLIDNISAHNVMMEPYRTLGHRAILTSSYTGQGIDEVREILRGKITVLAGMSGTGKSSLITAVQPGLEIRTSEVSDYSGEGRHTTTQTTLHPLDNGGSVVDTPGIREFGLGGMRRNDLGRFFPEIDELGPNCRFNNCSHLSEPDCAVQDARTQDKIAVSRYHSYRMIYETLPA